MLRILHIDDSEDEFVLIKLQIEKQSDDLQVEWSHSAHDAIQKLEKTHYDCIISDYQMPKLNGLELLVHLRKENNQTPFIFLTGQGSEEVAANAFQAGADAYYTKEKEVAHYQRLVNTIQRVVEADRQKKEKSAAQKALNESEAKLRSLFESTKDVIFFTALDGTILDINPSAEDLFGFSLEEIFKLNIAELYFNPSERKQYIKAIVDSGFVKDFPLRLRHRDGSHVHALVTSNVKYDDNDNVIGLQGIIRDVTERRHSEKRLAIQEEKYRNLFRYSNDMILLLALDGTILDANRKAKRALGYSDKEITSMNVSELHRPEILSEANQAFELLSVKGHVSYEIEFLKKDRGTFDAEVSSCLFEVGGEKIVQGIFRDITQRRRAELALQQSKQKFANVFQTSPDSITITRIEDGSYVEVNNGFERLTGYSRDEVIGESTLSQELWVDTDARTELAEKLKVTDEVIDYEADFQMKDGSIKRGLLSSKIMEIDGETCMVAVTRDISDRKRIETELRKERDLLHRFMESSPYCIVVLDLAGTIIYVNSQTEEELDVKKINIINRSYTNPKWIFADHQGNPVAQEELPFEIVKDTLDSVSNAPLSIKRSDGSMILLSVNAVPLFDGSSNFDGAVFIIENVTEKITAEKVLREREEQFRSVVQSLPMGMLICYLDGNDIIIEGSNHAADRIVGKSRSQLIGERADNLFPFNVDEQSLDGLYKAAFEGTPSHSRRIEQKGTTVAVAYDIDIFQISSKRIACVLNDITERIIAEEVLQESTQKYQMLVEKLHEGVLLEDEEGYITFVNPKTVEMLDYSENELIGKHWADIVPKQDIEKVKMEVGQRPGGRSSTYESHLLGKQKNKIPVLISATPVFNEKKMFRGVLSVLTDISDRKKAEQALRTSEERYRAFIEQSTEGIWCFEFDRPFNISKSRKKQFVHGLRHAFIAECNDAMAKMYGYERAEDIIGKRLNQLMSIHDPRALEYLSSIAISGYKMNDLETVEIMKNGQEKCFLNNFVGMVENGILKRVWGTRREITEKKKADEEIKKSRDQLERHSKELESINKEIKSFNYTVSHDLRTPLHNIDGYSQVILEEFSEELGETGTKYLKRIRANVIRMSNLIEDILNLSKVSFADFNRTSIDLSELAERIINDLKESNKNRQVEVTITQDLKADGDPQLIQNVLENLIANAWKFTSKTGKPRIEFGAESLNGSQVFYIRDNGIGFDQKNAKKLFTPFSRLHPNSEYEGSGIGLASVKRIIDRHSGKIWAEGKKEKGATFYFTLDSA